MIRCPNIFARVSLTAVLAGAPLASAVADGPAYAPVRHAPVAAVRPVEAPMAPQPVSVLRVDLSAGGAQSLAIPRGKSAIVELPVDVRDMMVTDPKVADAVLRTPRRIFVLGVNAGQTDAVFFDAAGRRILSLDIRVDQDTAALSETIHRVLPGSQVHVEPVNSGVILSGMVMTAGDADRAVRIAEQFVTKPENVLNMLSIAGKDQVMLKVRIVEVQRNIIKQLGMSTDILVNDGVKSYGFGRANTFGVNGGMMGGADLCAKRDNTRTTNYSNSSSTNAQNGTTSGNSSSTSSGASTSTTAGSTSSTTNTAQAGANIPGTVTVYDINGNPVTLSGLTAAQVTREAATNGVTTGTTTNGFTNGTSSGSTNAVTNLLTSAASTAYSAVTGTSATGCLQAFERVGLVRTLAEPNLTVVSGEAGRFLVGGEFPVPVGQDTTGRISLEFKPYGIGLGYTPVVLSGGRISLKLSTEVSELSNLGAFTVSTGGSSNLTVPGLSVRRTETTVELPSGGSMMIAGLLQQQTKQNIDSLPGMTSLPVLGSLFRSRDYLNGETELVVIITPYLVDAQSPDRFQTPADGLKIASDPESVLLGRLNTVVKAARDKAPPGVPASAPYQGPIGYVIE